MQRNLLRLCTFTLLLLLQSMNLVSGLALLTFPATQIMSIVTPIYYCL